MNIDDDILRKELSSTSDEKMKNIIATIQKEQNRIIRNVNDEILIIQGVAGSGKTSIALHRIAFSALSSKGASESSECRDYFSEQGFCRLHFKRSSGTGRRADFRAQFRRDCKNDSWK